MRRLLAVTLTLLFAAALHAENFSAGARKHYRGIALTDQNGKRVDLWDLMKGRVVVMHSFQTQCGKHCSLQMQRLQDIQTELASRMGKDLWIVSVTVDPQNDTPEVLKAYAEKLQAGPGWSFLTGKPEDVAKALTSFGQYTDNPKKHRGVLLIGKESTGQWRTSDALVKSATIKAIIETVTAAEPLKLSGASAPR